MPLGLLGSVGVQGEEEAPPAGQRRGLLHCSGGSWLGFASCSSSEDRPRTSSASAAACHCSPQSCGDGLAGASCGVAGGGSPPGGASALEAAALAPLRIFCLCSM
jgi:hypothetical protein